MSKNMRSKPGIKVFSVIDQNISNFCISSKSTTPSPLISNLWKAALASDTLPKVIPTEQKEAEDTDDEKEDEEVLVQENDEEEVCLNILADLKKSYFDINGGI